MKQKYLRFGAALLIVGILSAYFAKPVYACSPLEPTPWFIELIEPIGELPEGVTIIQAEEETIYLASGGTSFLKNSSPIPLYILGLKKEGVVGRPILDLPVEIPPGVEVIHKIHEDRAYLWDIRYESESKTETWAWNLQPTWNELPILTGGNSLQVGWALAANILELNKFKDNRPDETPIPDPQETSIPTIFGDQYLEIGLTISYSLNPDYRSDSVAVAQAGVEGCKNLWGFVDLILAMIVIVPIILILSLISKLIPQNFALKNDSEEDTHDN